MDHPVAHLWTIPWLSGRYATQFAKYIEKEIEGDGLEEMYEKAHEAIRADPKYTHTEKKKAGLYANPTKAPKRTNAERKAAVQSKKDAMRAALEADDDDDDDDDDE